MMARPTSGEMIADLVAAHPRLPAARTDWVWQAMAGRRHARDLSKRTQYRYALYSKGAPEFAWYCWVPWDDPRFALYQTWRAR